MAPYTVIECFKCFQTFSQADAAWGIAFASDGDTYAIQRVIELKIMPEISEMLYHYDNKLVTVALRIVGNIVSGNDEQVHIILSDSHF